MNDLSSEAQSLLDTARGADEPSAADRVRVRRALTASLAAGAAVASTAATAKGAALGSSLGGAGATLGVAKIAMWMGVGVVLGLAGAAVVEPFRADAPARSVPQPASIREPEAPSSARVIVAQEESAPPTAAAREEREIASVEAPVAPAPTDVPLGPRAPMVNGTSSLLAETRLLESARSALGRGDARGALSFLEQHEREFPSGVLVEERIAAKVFALCGLGRRADAARVAADLLRRAPASPLRARILDSCAYGN